VIVDHFSGPGTSKKKSSTQGGEEGADNAGDEKKGASNCPARTLSQEGGEERTGTAAISAESEEATLIALG